MANEVARRLRKQMTSHELKLWNALRSLRSQGYHFRRQSPISPYIVDFECRRALLVIEVDGGQHGKEKRRFLDEKRSKSLKAKGYRVLRFWNNEIDRELDAVMETILQELKSENIPHPVAARPPSPKRGGKR